jgi:hypothetical protein
MIQAEGATAVVHYVNGKLQPPYKIFDRRMVVYLTVKEKEAAKEFGVTWESDWKYSGSQFHIDRQRRFMEECVESHDCSGLVPTAERLEVPDRASRFIYVGSGVEGARLASPPINEQVRYSALSHC